MMQLPLFPLNTVLFPGMPLPLHIFEERYKQMIQGCLDGQQPFGVVFIDRGSPVGDPSVVPFTVGCSARILQVQPLAEGRMLIMTVGQERFRILSLKHDRPYLMGDVELAPLEGAAAMPSSPRIDQLHALVVEYLDILSRRGDVDFEVTQVATDTEKLLYLAAAFLQIPQEQKQPLLEINQAPKLLSALTPIYRQEVALMRMMPPEDQGMFSMN